MLFVLRLLLFINLLLVFSLDDGIPSMSAMNELPIFEACRQDNANEVKNILYENPEWLNIRGNGDVTPLMMSAIAGSISSLIYLLEQGADVEIPDEKGYTLMHAAATHGRDKIVRKLIEYGIPMNDMHADGFR